MPNKLMVRCQGMGACSLSSEVSEFAMVEHSKCDYKCCHNPDHDERAIDEYTGNEICAIARRPDGSIYMSHSVHFAMCAECQKAEFELP